MLKVVLIILIIDYNLLPTLCVKQVWKWNLSYILPLSIEYAIKSYFYNLIAWKYLVRISSLLIFVS